jgi:hypothetical protein
MKTRSILPTLFALALTYWWGAAPALADGPSADPWTTRHWAGWQLHWENDAFAVLSGSDEFYTNGLRFNWLRNPNVKGNPQWAEDFALFWCGLPLCPDSDPDVGYGHAFGQNFFTPTDLSVKTLIPDDRPYAGWLYYSFLINFRNDTDIDPAKTQPVQNLFELQLGVVGPTAGGEFVQREFHELIDDEPPLGWDNELEDEPGIALIYLWRKRLGGSALDLVPHWGASLGNVATYVNAGATVRLGKNISDFPLLLIAPTVAGFGREVPKKHEVYLFAAADARAVARNIFLDGNTFRDSHSVDKETFVYDFKAGFTYRRKGWRFTYTFVRRSKEFDPPPAGSDTDGAHDYGSLALSYQLWPPPGSEG